MEGYQRGEGWRIGEKVLGIRSMVGGYRIDREVKNSMGSGKAKELICKIHRCELRGGLLE